MTASGKAKIATKSLGRVSRAKAKRLWEKQLAQLSVGVVPIVKPDRISLSEFIELHEQAEGHVVRPATRAEWRTAVAHLMEAVGNVRLDRLDNRLVGRIRSHLKAEGREDADGRKIQPRSDATVRKTLSSLRAMFNNAVRRGWLHRNPLAGEKLGKPPKKQKRIFSDAEIDAMVAAAPNLWWEALLRTAYTTGCRRNELLHLRWSDFDQSAGLIKIQGLAPKRFRKRSAHKRIQDDEKGDKR